MVAAAEAPLGALSEVCKRCLVGVQSKPAANRADARVTDYEKD